MDKKALRITNIDELPPANFSKEVMAETYKARARTYQILREDNWLDMYGRFNEKKALQHIDML